MVLISIAMLILGMIMGFCLYRFCENGMISKKTIGFSNQEVISQPVK